MKIRSLCAVLVLCLLFSGWTLFPDDKTGEDLYINEVVTSNKKSYYDPLLGARDWIELYNASEKDIQLKGMYISDNAEKSDKLYELPDKTVPAGGYLVLLCGGNETEGVLPFGLSKKGEELSLVNGRREIIRTLSVPKLARDVSYARRADGSYGYCALPTPGAENTGEITDAAPQYSLLEEHEEIKTYLPLMISAVQTNSKQYFCESCGQYMDLVTVKNPNAEAVDIEGYILNDKDNPAKKGALAAAVLESGASVTVFCCGAGCGLKSEHGCIDLGLSKKGDSVYLFMPDKTLCDHVDVPALEEGDTYLRAADGSWTLKAAPKKLSPEKSSRPSAADAGQIDRNSSLILNELLYKNKYSVTDSFGDRSDFAELYNGSSGPLSLLGWYLSDSEKDLTKWALPDLTLMPGEYLVVFLSGRDLTGAELHASFRVSKGETLFLYNSAENCYDALKAYPVSSNASLGIENGVPVMYGGPTPGYRNGHAWPVTEQGQ